MKRYVIFAVVAPLLGGFCLLLTTTWLSGYWNEFNTAQVTKLLAVFVVDSGDKQLTTPVK